MTSAQTPSSSRAAAGNTAPAPRTTTMAAVVVIYHHPEDVDAFERYYAQTHVPLVNKHAGTLGVRRVDFTRFTSTLTGERPPYYRQASLWFDSEEALRKAMGMPEFKELADDLGAFATGGVTGLISVRTND